MKEIWKDIIWYEWLYEVSNLWRINSYARNATIWWILKQYNNSWYYNIALSKSWKKRLFKVHRLVWLTFLWLNINDRFSIVMHLDDNGLNNNITNLKLWTQKDNMQDMKTKWRQVCAMKWKFWKLNHRSKKVFQYDKNMNLINTFDSGRIASKYLQLNNSLISEVCNWKRKTHWWFIFKFL